MLNRIGPYTLDRWTSHNRKDASLIEHRTLRLRVERGGGICGPEPPKLKYGWNCYFIGRHPDHTTFSYRKA